MATRRKPAEGKVTFFEGPHTYENEMGQKYLSVTQLIHKFVPKFNALEQAKESVQNPRSKYFGRSIKSVLEEWDEAGLKARTGGTKFHKGKETGNTTQTIESEKKKRRELPGWLRKDASAIIPKEDDDVETDYTWLPDGVYDEIIVWNHEYHIAGIADKIIVDGDYFDVEDYKTNRQEKMTSQSYYKRGVGYQMLEWPLDHIMNAAIPIYELQLSLYAWMFSLLSGKKPRNLTILHHPTQPDGSVRETETRIPVKYKLRDITTMLKLWGGFAPPNFKPVQEDNKQEIKPDLDI